MTKVVKSARVSDYKKYVSALRLSSAMRRYVALFLAKLSGATTPSSVKHLCSEEKGWFEQQYTNGNTRAAHMTEYRRAITSMSAERSFPAAVLYEQKTLRISRYQRLKRLKSYGSLTKTILIT